MGPLKEITISLETGERIYNMLQCCQFEQAVVIFGFFSEGGELTLPDHSLSETDVATYKANYAKRCSKEYAKYLNDYHGKVVQGQELVPSTLHTGSHNLNDVAAGFWRR